MKSIKYILAIVVTLIACPQLSAIEFKLNSSIVGDIVVEYENQEIWKLDVSLSTLSDMVEELTIKLTADSPAVPPQMTVMMRFPQIDMDYLWSPSNGGRNQLRPDWDATYRSQLARWMPIYTLHDGNNTNSITIAGSEAMRDVKAKIGLREEGCEIVADLTYFETPEAPIDEYVTKIRIDGRKIFWADCVAEGIGWMTREANIVPVKSPVGAFDPLYSTWYQFHQNVSDMDIERECRDAVGLGMKTLIVDDGWQTDDNNRGYAFTGDWQISGSRFPDFGSHVKRVQDMGLRYLLWYSVPYIGTKSKNFERFNGKFLRVDAEKGVLDPRFPEVREFLCSTFEEAMKRYGLDGFKLDFIDAFNVKGEDPAIKDNYAGRDIMTVPEATDALMKEVYKRLKAINPDVLIEFRQAYVGPAIRQYGNMLRADDCPGDLRGNRERIANMRLTSGETAVHADMLEWNAQESPESAARALQSAMFGVVQYSVMLRDLPEAHKKMLTHWLNFIDNHKTTLLKSNFRPYNPEAGFPVIEASSPDERIIAVYQDNAVAKVSGDRKPTYIINSDAGKSLYVDLDYIPASLEVFDVYGNRVSGAQPSQGLNKLMVPPSGYVLLN